MNHCKQTYSNLAQRFSLLRDEPMKRHTSFKVGGPADLFAMPETVTGLNALLAKVKEQDIPVTIIGGGTNLLITDKGIRGLVISTKNLKSQIQIMDRSAGTVHVRAQAGERLGRMVNFASDQGLSGLEFAAGIPGTVGGAVIMNAGTPQGSMAGIIDCVEILDPDTLEIKTISRDDINFSYRKTSLDNILIAVTVTLTQADPEKIKTIVTAALSRKKNTQPVSQASAGCYFKNPVQGKSAGWLIEAAGLKGLTVNGAKVSELHANYIVNSGNATCRDILDLQEKIQKTIQDKFQITLETEVRVNGE